MTTINFRAPWSASLRTMTVLAVAFMALIMIAAIIVISPHDPQHFIMRARTLIKAAEFPK